MRYVAAAVFLFFGLGVALAQGKPSVPPPKSKTKAEVLAMIKKIGATPPDWFAATPLNFPKTLDLTWTPPPQGSPWDPNKNVGQFIWTSINENEARWKEGIKFLHHMHGQQGQAGHRETGDGVARQHVPRPPPGLGSRRLLEADGGRDGHPRARPLLLQARKQGDGRRDPDQVRRRQFAPRQRHPPLGRSRRPRQAQAGRQMANGIPDAGNLAAGDVCKAMGKFPEALAYYQKVLDAKSGSRDIDHNKKRAQGSIDALKVFDGLDLKKVPDGKYTANSIGYTGPVDVEVSVAGGKITDVRVTQHHEKQYYSSITETCAAIIQKQGAKGVDATSGATITSEAIINATVKALPRK
jgi:uncharacterized protein with FMN-binding domain